MPAGADLSDEQVAVSVHPGQANYDQFCSICHKVGVGGAPVLGDTATWADRIANGTEQMIQNAINGVSSDSGVMPPKGGFMQLSDDEVRDAVEYMVGESS